MSSEKRRPSCLGLNVLKCSGFFSPHNNPSAGMVLTNKTYGWVSAQKRNSGALAMELHLSCPNQSI